MKRQKLLSLCALLLCAALFAAACAKAPPAAAPLPTGYVEQPCSLPEEAGKIADMARLSDGSYALLYSRKGAGRDGPWKISVTKDGLTWQERETPFLSQQTGPFTIQAAQLTPEGGAYLLCNGRMEEENGERLVYDLIELSGEGRQTRSTPLKMTGDAWVNSMKTSPQGDLLLELNAGFVQLDGAELTEKFRYLQGESDDLFSDNTLQDYAFIGSSLVISYKSTLTYYNPETGEMIDSIETDPISERFYSPGTLRPMGRARLLAPAMDGEALFYCDQNGIFSRTQGGGINERILESTSTSLSLPTRKPLRLLTGEDGAFFILYEEGEGYFLAKYVFSSDAPAEKTTLRVYSLMEFNSRRIRQTIGQFQLDHPDTLVTYTAGISEDARQSGAVTTSDAVRTLSTQLLAGNGPDILVLDRLPIDALREKGVLLDLTDFAQEKADTGALVPQVATGLRARDGKIYGVPTCFSLPVMLGAPEIVENIHSYSDLADYCERAAAEKPDRLPIEYLHPGMLIESFYPLCANAWLGDPPDKEAARAFLTDTLRIGALWTESTPTPNHDLYYEGWYRDQIGLATGELTSLYDLDAIGSLLQGGDKEGRLMLLPGDQAGYYTPANVIGLNAGSPQLEKAKLFLEAALSPAVQKYDYFDGLPVSLTVLEAQLTSDDPLYTTGTNLWDLNDESYPLEFVWPNPEYAGIFRELLQSAAIPAYPDETVQDLFYESIYPCIMENGSTLDECLDDFWGKYEIRQAE